MLAGGISANVALDAESTAILAYIRTVDPAVATAAVTRLDSQVVAGTLYRFHFNVNGADVEVKAWSKPWENFLQVTTSAGV